MNSVERIVVDGDGYGKDGYRVIEIYYDSSRSISRVKIDSVGNTVFDSSNEIPHKAPKEKGNIIQPQRKTYEDILKNKCMDLNKDALINSTEVEKFFKHYQAILVKGWNGSKFDADALWNIWISKVK